MHDERDDYGVPELGQEEIETKVEDLLSEFDRVLLHEPCATPVRDISLWLNSRFGIPVNLSADLGVTRDGRRIYGQFDLRDRSIAIDSSLQQDEKKRRATLAHEIAHLVLHRDISSDLMMYGEVGVIVDTERESVESQIQKRDAQLTVEQQADHFTSALLLPRRTVPKVLVHRQDQLGIRRGRGKIWVDWKRQATADLRSMVGYIAARFRVGRDMTAERLDQIGLIHREAPPSTGQWISDILGGRLRKAS